MCSLSSMSEPTIYHMQVGQLRTTNLWPSEAKKRGNVLVKVKNHEPLLSPWLEFCVVIIVQWTTSSVEKHFPDYKRLSGLLLTLCSVYCVVRILIWYNLKEQLGTWWGEMMRNFWLQLSTISSICLLPTIQERKKKKRTKNGQSKK